MMMQSISTTRALLRLLTAVSYMTFVASQGTAFVTHAELRNAVNQYCAGTFDSSSAYGPIESWDVSQITNMEYLFWEKRNCNPDIGGWDVSNVQNFLMMFHRTDFNQYIGDWDVSSGTNFVNMFAHSKSFDQDLSGWDVSSGTKFTNMFRGTYGSGAFLKGDISNWDVSSGTDFDFMFAYNDSFGDHDLSGWDVSSGTNFMSMFRKSYAFNGDISNWDVSSGTAFSNMLKNAHKFNHPTLYCKWSNKNPSFKNTNTDFCSGSVSCGFGANCQDTPSPTASPILSPTMSPTTPAPTESPVTPATPSPTAYPIAPTTSPTTPAPTKSPVIQATPSPTASPKAPTASPTTPAPTESPVIQATPSPTASPKAPTASPTTPAPTESPVTSAPTYTIAKERSWYMDFLSNITVANVNNSLDVELSQSYNISNRAFDVKYYKDDCKSELVHSISQERNVRNSDEANGFLNLQSTAILNSTEVFYAEEGREHGDDIFNGDENGGFITLCIRTDIFLTDDKEVSMNFLEKKVNITVDLKSGSFMSNEEGAYAATRDEAATEDDISFDYSIYLEAYECDANRAYVKSDNAVTYEQGSILNICVKSINSEVIEVESITNMLIEQDVDTNGKTFKYISDGNYNDDITYVDCDTNSSPSICISEMNLLAMFFEEANPPGLKISGDVSMTVASGESRLLRGAELLLKPPDKGRALETGEEPETGSFDVRVDLGSFPMASSTSKAHKSKAFLPLVSGFIGGVSFLVSMM